MVLILKNDNVLEINTKFALLTIFHWPYIITSNNTITANHRRHHTITTTIIIISSTTVNSNNSITIIIIFTVITTTTTTSISIIITTITIIIIIIIIIRVQCYTMTYIRVISRIGRGVLPCPGPHTSRMVIIWVEVSNTHLRSVRVLTESTYCQGNGNEDGSGAP